MNRDLAVDDRHWAIQAYDSPQQQGVEYASALDFSMLLRILREWKWLILAAVAAGLAIAVIYTMVITPMYRATVILQVNPPEVEILDEKTGAQTEGQTPADFVATQVGLLSSRSLAERVVQDLNLTNNDKFVPQSEDPGTRLQDATQQIADNLIVTPPDSGQLIKFTFDSVSPQLSASIANGVADAFINSNLQRKYQSSAYARNFLEHQIAKIRAELQKSERDLVDYARAQGIINTATSENSTPLSTDANSPQGQALTATNEALAAAIARRVATEGAYRAGLTGGITPNETQDTQRLRESRAGLLAQYQQKLQLMKPDYPDMVSLRSQIAELDKQIAKATSDVASARINSLRDDYQAALSAERALQSKMSELKGEVLDLRGRSIRYAILQRDVDTNRALYDALLQRYKEVGVAGGIGIAPVSVVDRAEPPTERFKPNVMLNVAVGLILGLLGGVFAAVGLELLNDTVKTREDVRKKLGLACLGTVPKRPAKGEFVEDLKDPTSAVSESYSTVAASLGFSTERGDPKVLLMTSARPSEGKSSSALALAQNFSRRGKSVLLIDCDLRKPAFKTPREEGGLTTLLTNNNPVLSAVSPTHFKNLSLLPSGPVPPNPADLLSTSRFHTILSEASAHFDLVIIDSPPVIGLADSPLLASICKNVMFVIEAGKTRTGVARDAIGKMKAAGAHILGATLTKSAEGSSSYSYGYGYGYGHKYSKMGKRRTEIGLIPDSSEN